MIKLSVQDRIRRQVEIMSSKTDVRAVISKLEDTYEGLKFIHFDCFSQAEGTVECRGGRYITQIAPSAEYTTGVGYNLIQVTVFREGAMTGALEHRNVTADELLDGYVSIVSGLIFDSIRTQRRVDKLAASFAAA